MSIHNTNTNTDSGMPINNTNTNTTALSITHLDIEYRFYEDVRAYFLYPIIALNIFGVATNSLNMAVFAKLWSRDTTSISLVGLTVSDFFVCLTGVASSLTELPSIQNLVIRFLNWHPRDFTLVFMGQPNVIFARVTISITAFITLERCICVAIPLKVKIIFTRRVVKLIIAFCFGFTIAGYLPIYFVFNYINCFFPPVNRYITCLTVKARYWRYLQQSLMPFSVWLFYGFQFCSILVCTAILIVVLIRKTKWRRDATSSSTTTTRKGRNSSTKESRVVRMMAMLSSLFVVCNIPMSLTYLWHEFDRNYSIHGSLRHKYLITVYTAFFFEAINSSMNTVIYYNNSSNYKMVFDKIFNIKAASKSG